LIIIFYLFQIRCLYDKFDYETAHEELEERSTLKVEPLPKRRNRASAKRNRQTQLLQDA
jgi:hypothetical protein